MARYNSEHADIAEELGLARVVGLAESSRVIGALFALLGALVAGFHGWVHVAVENAALRQQLAVFKEKRPRPSLSPAIAFSGSFFIASGRAGAMPSSSYRRIRSSGGIATASVSSGPGSLEDARRAVLELISKSVN